MKPDLVQPQVDLSRSDRSPAGMTRRPAGPTSWRAESSWYPGIWQRLPAHQQPDWPGPAIGWVRESLRALPALSTAADVRLLCEQIRAVQAGNGFLLQAGDCAEPFGAAAVLGAARKHHTLGRMATAISERTGVAVLTVGRLAGQFAKPRSNPTELVDGRALPSFRGLIINGAEPTEAGRQVRASRLIEAHHTAHEVFAELHRLSGSADDRGGWAAGPPTSLATRPSYGQTEKIDGSWVHNGLWTSHEALVLDYEEPLARRDEVTGEWYLGSTHLPWVGYRTNQPDGAHVTFLSGVANPIACKVGPDTDRADLVRTCAVLDPRRTPGRLVLISRQGASLLRERLPAQVLAVRAAGHPVVWMCDPMHGNTVKTASGRKTRFCSDILDELRGFFDVLGDLGEWPGGVHLEVAGEDVTECVGGGGPGIAELPRAYRSLCDPRLNDVQCDAIARALAELLTTAARARLDATAASLLAAQG